MLHKYCIRLVRAQPCSTSVNAIKLVTNCQHAVANLSRQTIGGPIQCVVSYRDQCARVYVRTDLYMKLHTEWAAYGQTRNVQFEHNLMAMSTDWWQLVCKLVTNLFALRVYCTRCNIIPPQNKVIAHGKTHL